MSSHVISCWNCKSNTWATESECVHCGAAINPLHSPVPSGEWALQLQKITLNAIQQDYDIENVSALVALLKLKDKYNDTP